MVKPVPSKVGIVQGRLLPPIGGRIQAFPKENWESEFSLLREAGFDGLEWIFDGEENPILQKDGRKKIQKLSRTHRVEIPSVSGDYLMFNPIFGATKTKSIQVLKKLIVACGALAIPQLNLPLEDQSELKTSADVADAVHSLEQCLPLAEKHGVILATESSLPPENFLAFMKRVNHQNFKINYDLGNSRACGYPTDFALRLLAPYLVGIHIKDRKELYGPTVSLGTGGTDFATHFKTLQEVGYRGWFIIQGARGENDLETGKRYLQFTRHLLTRS